MTCIPRQLRGSVAGRWYENATGRDGYGSSWLTRTSYYQAIEEALKLRPMGELIDAREVVAQHPKGAVSTFYAVAARNPLIQAYRRNVTEPVRQITDLLARTDPLNQMLAEAQVWSFWPHRVGWIRWMDDGYPNGDFPIVTQHLIEQIRRWRVEHPHLAAVGAGLPLCSVEDVVILSRGRITPKEAGPALTRTLQGSTRLLEVPATIDLRAPRPRRPLPEEGGRATAEAFVREALALLGARPDHAAVQDKLQAALDVLQARDRES